MVDERATDETMSDKTNPALLKISFLFEIQEGCTEGPSSLLSPLGTVLQWSNAHLFLEKLAEIREIVKADPATDFLHGQ